METPLVLRKQMDFHISLGDFDRTSLCAYIVLPWNSPGYSFSNILSSTAQKLFCFAGFFTFFFSPPKIASSLPFHSSRSEVVDSRVKIRCHFNEKDGLSVMEGEMKLHEKRS